MPEAEWLPDDSLIVAKDLGIAQSIVPGNPYCRFDTESNERQYCSADLWEEMDEQFVIPEDESLPKPLVVCQVCGNDSYKDANGECGMCGVPIFDCPGCGEEVHGQVDECPHCGAGYKWPDNESEDMEQ